MAATTTTSKLRKPRPSENVRPRASTTALPDTKSTTKTTDSKGRVVLGGRFANRAVIIEQLNDSELLIKLARIIPEREVWLYQSAEALGAVRTGLAQARARKLTKGPDLKTDAQFAARLEI